MKHRIFKIDIGNIPLHKAMEFLEKIKEEISKKEKTRKRSVYSVTVKKISRLELEYET